MSNSIALLTVGLQVITLKFSGAFMIEICVDNFRSKAQILAWLQVGNINKTIFTKYWLISDGITIMEWSDKTSFRKPSTK